MSPDNKKSYKFSNTSKKRLLTCDKKLQDIFNEVIKERDITIVCGHRNEKDQNHAYNNGYSKVKFPNSRHNSMPSTAVDVVPYPEMWSSKIEFFKLAIIVKKIAKNLGIQIQWGHDLWNWDMPHWQLKINKKK